MATTLQVPSGTGVTLTGSFSTFTAAQKAAFVLVESTNAPDLQKAVYRYSEGAAADTMEIVLTRRYDSKRDRTFVTIQLTAVEKTTDADGNITYDPIAAGVMYNHSGRTTYDAESHLMVLVQLAVGSVLGDGTALNVVDMLERIDHSILTAGIG